MSNPTNSPTPHGRPAISPAGSAMLAAYAMLPLIASATVALRILANEVKRKRLGADDYTIVGSLVLAASLSMMSIYAILEGLHGSPVGGIKSVGDLIRRNELMFAGLLICHLAIGLVKVSCVIFYRKIFVTRKFLVATNVMLGVLAIWMAVLFFCGLFQTTPISAWWLYGEPDLEPFTNIPAQDLLFAASLSDLVLDMLVVTMPIPVIRTLNLERKKKILISGIFLLGGFCIVASAIRLHYVGVLYKFSRSEIDFIGIADLNSFWGQMEAFASVLAACLPALGPLFTRHQRLSARVLGRAIFGRAFGGKWNRDEKNVGDKDKDEEKM